jgi:hypothetical protein
MTPCSSKMQSTDSTLFGMGTLLWAGLLRPACSYLSVGGDPDETYAGSCLLEDATWRSHPETINRPKQGGHDSAPLVRGVPMVRGRRSSATS